MFRGKISYRQPRSQAMSMEESKKCNLCMKILPICNFSRNRGKCRECRNKQSSEWVLNNKIRHSAYQSDYKNHRYGTDLLFKIKCVLRSRLNKAMRNKWKSGSSVDDLGCSIEEFKLYIESKFSTNMSWDNHSKRGWHIDHIIPLSAFDLTDPEQVKRACHYTNLQPLWAEDNESKGDKNNVDG